MTTDKVTKNSFIKEWMSNKDDMGMSNRLAYWKHKRKITADLSKINFNETNTSKHKHLWRRITVIKPNTVYNLRLFN